MLLFTKENRFAKDKPDLLKKNPLMNLPYVIDGETVITQSNACFLYLGRKFNLNGKNEDEIAKNDQVFFKSKVKTQSKVMCDV